MTKLEMIQEFNKISKLGHSINARIKDIKAVGRSLNCQEMARVIKNTEDMTFPSFYGLDLDTKLTKSDIAKLIKSAIAGLEMADRLETNLLNCLVFMGS